MRTGPILRVAAPGGETPTPPDRCERLVQRMLVIVDLAREPVLRLDERAAGWHGRRGNWPPRSASRASCPRGRSTTRFSTLPSLPTSTASACLSESQAKPNCFYHLSRRGTMTRPAQAERPESKAVAVFSASSIGPSPLSSRSMRGACPRQCGSPAIMRRRSRPQPAFGRHATGRGMRRGQQAGFLRSCMTLRMEAGDSDRPGRRLIVRGQRECRCPDRIRPRGRNTSRARSLRRSMAGPFMNFLM